MPRQREKGGLSKAKSIKTTHAIYVAELDRLGLEHEEYEHVLQGLKAKGNTFFMQVFIKRSDAALTRFAAGFLATIREMVDPLVEIYPNCMWYTFNSCPYKVPCMMRQNGIDPGPILREGFVKAEPRYKLDDVEPIIVKE